MSWWSERALLKEWTRAVLYRGKLGTYLEVKCLYLFLIYRSTRSTYLISGCHNSKHKALVERVTYIKARSPKPIPCAPCSRTDQTGPGIGFLTMLPLVRVGSSHQWAVIAMEGSRSSTTTRSVSAMGKCVLLVGAPAGRRKASLSWVGEAGTLEDRHRREGNGPLGASGLQQVCSCWPCLALSLVWWSSSLEETPLIRLRVVPRPTPQVVFAISVRVSFAFLAVAVELIHPADKTCVCTSNVTGRCNAVARTVVDLIPRMNTLFGVNFTTSNVSLTLWDLLGDPLNDCSKQALLVDVAPGLAVSSSPNRAEFARAAILYSLMETESLNTTAQMRSFIAGADFSKLAGQDTPVQDDREAVGLTFGADGFLYNFASMTLRPPSISWKDNSQATGDQTSRVNSIVDTALDRMYSFSTGTVTRTALALAI